MATDKDDSAESLRLIRCYVADISYCLDMAWVRTILRSDTMEAMPEKDELTGATGRIAGENEEILVYALGEALGIPGKSKGQLLVSRDTSAPWALLVDRLSRVVVVESDRVHPIPGISGAESQRLFRGIVLFDEGPSLYLRPGEVRLESPVASKQPTRPAAPAEPAEPQEVKASPASLPAKHQKAGSLLLFSNSRNGKKHPIIFGLSLSQIAEIMDFSALVPLPKSPSYVLGLTTWRDRPVPIVDLAERLSGKPTQKAEGARIIIIHTRGGDLIGVPATRDLRVLDLPAEYRPYEEELPLDRKLIRGAFELQGKTMVVPDLDAVIDPVNGSTPSNLLSDMKPDVVDEYLEENSSQ